MLGSKGLQPHSAHSPIELRFRGSDLRILTVKTGDFHMVTALSEA